MAPRTPGLPGLIRIIVATTAIGSGILTFKPATAQALASGVLSFVENRGQIADAAGNPLPHVLFKASAPGLELYVTTRGLTCQFIKVIASGSDGPAPGNLRYHSDIVEMELNGASISRGNVVTGDPLEGRLNFFYSHCPDGIYDVQRFQRITIRNVYPHIDWVIFSDPSGFKHEFMLHPGADENDIVMTYRSPWKTSLSHGGIGVETTHAKFTESPPESFIASTKQPVPSKFRILSGSREGALYRSTFGFELPAGKPVSETLVIDPLLTWSTFYGGNAGDILVTTEIDKNGNVFVAGGTNSFNLPLVNSGGYFQTTGSTVGVQLIIKFNAAGVMQWATYYGGTQTSGGSMVQTARSLAIDTAGNVFMCGSTTMTNFPVQNGGGYFQGTMSGFTDATLVKFTNNGTRIRATYFGGSSSEEGLSVAADQAGNVFMVGVSQSTDMPVQTAGTYFQPTSTLLNRGYVTKFDVGGNLVWSTYFDGLSPYAAAVDASQNLVLTGNGHTGSLILQNPGGGAYFQNTGSIIETAVVKFANNGTLTWSTYFGGNDIDGGRCIAADRYGQIFIAGITTSTNFPLLGAGGFSQTTIGSTALTIGDAYIAKFSPAGTLMWSTYYGGDGYENHFSFDNLATDTCGKVYLSFHSRSTNMPFKRACEGGYLDSTFDNSSVSTGDIFLTRFSNQGVQEWATYLGGTGNDNYSSLDVNASGELYMTGDWTVPYNQNTNYPIVVGGTGSYMDSTGNGSSDAFMVRFAQAPSTQSFKYGGPFCQSHHTVAVTGTDLSGGGTYSATPGLSVHPATGVITPSASSPGTHTVTYAVTFTNCTCAAYGAISNSVITTTVTILPPPPLTVTPGATICTGQTASLVASGAQTYTWNTGSNSNTLVVSPGANSNYTISAMSSSGCVTSQTTMVTVLPSPTVGVSGTYTICAGTLAPLTATGAATYSWSTGNQAAAVQLTPAVTSTFSVTGFDPNGCSDTYSLTLHVLPQPLIYITGDTVICTGDTTQLNAQGGATSYSWSTSHTTHSVLVSPKVNTIYLATGTGTNGCTSTKAVLVTVDPAPALIIAGNQTICSGTSAQLTVSGAYTYSWSNGAQLPFVSLQPLVTTVYTVTGLSKDNCLAKMPFTVTVVYCLGAAESDKIPSLKIFPNPAPGRFVVECDRTVQLELLNELGQMVKMIRLDAGTMYRAEVGELAAGVYLCRPLDGRVPGIKIVIVD